MDIDLLFAKQIKIRFLEIYIVINSIYDLFILFSTQKSEQRHIRSITLQETKYNKVY